MNRKIAQVFLALLIGVVFLSSYLTFANLKAGAGGNTQQAKTTTIPATNYGFAYADATFVNYNDTLNVSATCKNYSAAISNVTSLVLDLEQNNSVYNYYPPQPGEIAIETGSMNATGIYSYISKNINASTKACVSFSAETEISLPDILEMYIGGTQPYSIPVPANLRQLQLLTSVTGNLSAQIPVKILALVTNNGTIYSLSANLTTPSLVKQYTNSTKPKFNLTSTGSQSKPAANTSNAISSNSISSNAMTSNTPSSSNAMTENTMISSSNSMVETSNAMSQNAMGSNTMDSNSMNDT